MILTREAIHKGKSQRGGWTRKQTAVLGVSWPLKKGWLMDLVGKEVPDEAYAQFLAYKSDKYQLELLELAYDKYKSARDFANEQYETNRADFD